MLHIATTSFVVVTIYTTRSPLGYNLQLLFRTIFFDLTGITVGIPHGSHSIGLLRAKYIDSLRKALHLRVELIMGNCSINLRCADITVSQ